ncbi:MAG TPA: 23S rRNA (uracil(1939)-C(5))-methyltransferase RlmD, partial [Steroidobacteraceae bacterium]|nr:23S rRNA (uracil(1939)-C(5))-methyltransferase RlmD [Steroidobacteraceae bacterium]
PGRVVPRCAHFGVCGGCAMQHLSPEAQLEAKHAELRDNLERLGHVAPRRWLPPLRGPVWGYRRRARLGAKYVGKKGRVLVGFRERLAPFIADVQHCDVLAPPVGELITPLAALIMSLDIRDRVPQIEVAVADNAVALVFRVLDPPSPADLQRFREFRATHGLRLYLQPGGLDTVHELDTPGEPLRYALPRFAVELEFLPTDFIQINGAVNAALVSQAVEMLELTPEATVLDLFCGIGNFTLPIARSAGRVVGVEGDAALVARARHNARHNGLENTEFHVADLARLPASLQEAAQTAPWLREAYTHVVMDPPRAGAREVLGAVAGLAPRRVLYISCHPGSLARDLGVLVNEHGFDLEAAGVLDMFPHTAHFESLALLSPPRRKGRQP